MRQVDWPRLIVRKHQFIFGIGILIGLMACLSLRGLAVQNAIQDWLDPGSASFRVYQDFLKHFGSDDILYLAFRTDEIFSPKDIRRYGAEIQTLSRDETVHRLLDPASQYWRRFSGGENDEQKLAVLTESKFQEYLEELASRAAFSNLLISNDGKTAGLMIVLNEVSREQKIRFLKKMTNRLDEAGFFYRISGPLFFSEALASGLRQDLMRMLPLLLILAFVILLMILRSGLVAGSILLGIGLSGACALTVFSLSGTKLSLASLIIFPLLFCVGMSTAVHFFMKIFRSGAPWELALKRGFQDVLIPAAAATGTTALGTTAFLFAPQKAVRMIGLAAPLGIILTFLAIFFFVPSMIQTLSRSLGRFRRVSFTIKSLVPSSRSYRMGVVVLFAVVGACSVMAFPRLQINTEAIYFFKEDSKLIGAYRYIENHLTGTVPVELVFKSTDGEQVTSPDHMAVLFRFRENLRGLQGVAKIDSLFEPLDEVFQRMKRGDIRHHYRDEAMIRKALERLDERAPQVRKTFLSDAADVTRMTLRFRNLARSGYPEIKKQIGDLWRSLDSSGLKMEMTGIIPMILEGQNKLLQDQLKAFMMIAGLIIVCFFAVFRKAPLVMFAVLANGIPLAVTAGVAAILTIAVNSINVFVVAVLLGVIVDDTLFLLYAFRKHGSMRRAVEDTGPALAMTSVIVALCFSVLLLSNFKPVVQFSFLAVVAIATAYVCDVCFLPAIVGLWTKKED